MNIVIRKIKHEILIEMYVLIRKILVVLTPAVRKAKIKEIKKYILLRTYHKNLKK